jgi:tRNA(Ile)-lysidine synthase
LSFNDGGHVTPLTLPAWAEYAAKQGCVRRLLVGFSGGVDSTVLLHLACQWSRESGVPVLALHINHQLSPQASQWQRHCQSVCEAWGVPLLTDTVQVINAGQGLEAAARDARYESFARVAQAGDLLLLGHHRDDQVETVFMRLLRGSGVLGLRGIEASVSWRQARILRPLLPFSKKELLAFARAQGWSWVEDESNASDAFDRNFLRHHVLPVLEQRWPALTTAIQRTARHCDEAQGLLDDLAKADLLARVEVDGGLALDIAGYPTLSDARRRNLLRYWLRCQGLPLPGEAQLEQVLNALLPAAEDAVPVVRWPGAEIRRFRGRLHAMQPLPELRAFSRIKSTAVPSMTPMVLDLPEAALLPGIMALVSPLGGTLFVHSVHDAVTESASLPLLSSGRLSVRYRQGGETCKLARRPGRPLKKVLQESALAPWWRERLPLIYVDDTLAVVPGLGVCEGFQAGKGEAGLRFDWQPPQLPQAWRD